MEFVAASAALGATTYQKRLCEHQFAGNRACVAKWILHCGIGQTATNKQRLSRCAHGLMQHVLTKDQQESDDRLQTADPESVNDTCTGCLGSCSVASGRVRLCDHVVVKLH